MSLQANPPQDFDFWMEKGAELEKQEKYSESLTAFRNAAELNPQDSAIWSSIGFVLGCLERRQEALDAYDHAIELDPKSAPAVHNKAFYFEWFGVNDEDTEQAIALYRKALELNPKLHAPWCQLAFLLLEKEDYDEALEVFVEAINSYDEEKCAGYVDGLALLWAGKAKCLANLYAYKEALDAFDKAQSIDEDSFDKDSFYEIGIIFMHCDKFDEAQRIYLQGTEKFPEEYALWHNLGYALYELSRYEDACVAADKAIELYTTDSKHWCLRGECLKKLGRNDEALASFQQAEKCDGDNHDARYPISFEFHEDDPCWWHMKGTLLVEIGRHEEALVAFDRAIEENPHSAGYWENKGLLLSELGREAESVQAYNRAEELKLLQ